MILGFDTSTAATSTVGPATRTTSSTATSTGIVVFLRLHRFLVNILPLFRLWCLDWFIPPLLDLRHDLRLVTVQLPDECCEIFLLVRWTCTTKLFNFSGEIKWQYQCQYDARGGLCVGRYPS